MLLRVLRVFVATLFKQTHLTFQISRLIPRVGSRLRRGAVTTACGVMPRRFEQASCLGQGVFPARMRALLRSFAPSCLFGVRRTPVSVCAMAQCWLGNSCSLWFLYGL